ncbi:CPBP family intramembrane metalloprotease [Halostella sp. JP-L12]|uniref:CPBP family glutamic-type intramembrane protease n=1 Tax=Halostella TaxID=1843185 RepID=UPI000EF7857D|nr:CPBP family intramembrane metalloprotease [Halostella sp. JP-L12]
MPSRSHAVAVDDWSARATLLGYTALTYAISWSLWGVWAISETGSTPPGTLLFGGGLEEPGRRGYLLPAHQEAYSPLTAGLLVGVVWAGWHLPLVFIPGTIQHTLPLGLYLFQLVELSILLTWLTNWVDGRILPAILLHAGANALLNYYPVGGAAGATTPLGFGLLVMMLAIAVVALAISAGQSLGVARPAR